MKLSVYARPDLVDSDLSPESPALLLEGSWPAAAVPTRWSLDVAIGARQAWIDEQAVEWAQSLAKDGLLLPRGNPLDHISSAYLNALDLRYYLVKLLRLVAFFTEVQPLVRGQSVELSAQRHRDYDYADLLEQLSRRAGIDCRVRWIDAPQSARDNFPRNGRLRQLAARVAQCFDLRAAGHRRRPRVVLCGNPHLLDPVCGELLRRRASVWWLFDRFAVKPFLRWRPRGVGQLVCNADLGRENRFYSHLPERLDCCGVNLAPAVGGWLTERLLTHGPRQTRLVEQIYGHFQQFGARCPDPGRGRHAAGPRGGGDRPIPWDRIDGRAACAPCCRFGFAPLAADRILVWGESSREQLLRWGVAAEQIWVTGSPCHDRLRARFAKSIAQNPGQTPAPQGSRNDSGTGSMSSRFEAVRRAMRQELDQPHFLLLATMPPRDDRPDAVALGLNTRTYADMLRTVLTVVARRPDAQLTIKLHPRAGDDPMLRQVLHEFPQIEARLVRHATLEKTLRGVDCVFSCGSSGGVDSTLAGIPVIQILPPGVHEFLPHQRWGLAGTAHCEAELEPLLRQALEQPVTTPAIIDPQVFGDFQRPAAQRIVEEVFALAGQTPCRLSASHTGGLGEVPCGPTRIFIRG